MAVRLPATQILLKASIAGACSGEGCDDQLPRYWRRPAGIGATLKAVVMYPHPERDISEAVFKFRMHARGAAGHPNSCPATDGALVRLSEGPVTEFRRVFGNRGRDHTASPGQIICEINLQWCIEVPVGLITPSTIPFPAILEVRCVKREDGVSIAGADGQKAADQYRDSRANFFNQDFHNT